MNLANNLSPITPLPRGAQLTEIELSTTRLAVLELKPENYTSTVLLTHGFTGSKEDFFAIATQLGQYGFRVIAHDHRGQNQSAHASASAYTLNQLAQDIAELMTIFDLEKVHLLGHSFGGLVAQEFALNFPDKLHSLTLFCSGPGAITPMAENLKTIISVLEPRDMEQAWKYFIENESDVPIQGDSDLSSMRSRRWLNSDKHSVLAQAQILLTAPNNSLALVEHNIYTHVVYGEFDDAWPIDEQLDLANKLNARVSMIANTGHCPNEEDPKTTAETLANYWLGNHDKSI